MRSFRGQRERMLLMGADRVGEGWALDVKGQSGRVYTVSMTPHYVACTCPDHLYRRVTCKHAFFVVQQVAGCDAAAADSQGRYAELDAALRDRLQGKPRGGQCAICFEEVAEGNSCCACSNTFHDACIRAWTAANPTCPLCRAGWLPVSIARPCADDQFQRRLRGLVRRVVAAGRRSFMLLRTGDDPDWARRIFGSDKGWGVQGKRLWVDEPTASVRALFGV